MINTFIIFVFSINPARFVLLLYSGRKEMNLPPIGQHWNAYFVHTHMYAFKQWSWMKTKQNWIKRRKWQVIVSNVKKVQKIQLWWCSLLIILPSISLHLHSMQSSCGFSFTSSFFFLLFSNSHKRNDDDDSTWNEWTTTSIFNLIPSFTHQWCRWKIEEKVHFVSYIL